MRQGKWKLNEDGSAICSECGHIQYNCWDLDNCDNFCHFCGADMRDSLRCKFCGGLLSEVREHNGKKYRHCFSCHFEFEENE